MFMNGIINFQVLLLLGILICCTYLSLAVYRMLKAVQYIRDTGKNWLGLDVRKKCMLVGENRPSSVITSLW